MVHAVTVVSALLLYYVLIARAYGQTATTQAPQKVGDFNIDDAIDMAKQTELEAQKATLKAKQAGLHAQKARLKAHQTGQVAQAAANGPQPAASKASVSTTQSQTQTPGQADAGKSIPVHPAHVVAEHANIEAQQANVKAQEAMAEAEEARIQAQKAALQAQKAAQAHKSEDQATVTSLQRELQAQRAMLNQLKEDMGAQKTEMWDLGRQLASQWRNLSAQQTGMNIQSAKLNTHNKWIINVTKTVAIWKRKLPALVPAISNLRGNTRQHSAVFHASAAYNSDWTVGAKGHVVLRFQCVDHGHAYNNATGVFTAPHSGDYFFTATAHAPFVTKTRLPFVIQTRRLRIVTLDTPNVVRPLAQTSIRWRSQGTCSTLVHLQQGQKVWLTTAPYTRFAGAHYTTFSGFRV